MEASAYHEAGHAIIARALGLSLRRVTIERDVDAEGRCDIRTPKWFTREVSDGLDTPRAKALAIDVIVAKYAGPLAERKYRRSHNRCGARQDYQSIVDLAGRYCGESGQAGEAFLRWLRITAREMVEHHWPAISTVASDLLERQTLTEADVDDALVRE